MFGVPVLTHLLRIVENGRLSSVVLPIVCVDTDIPFMIIFSVRTPDSLKMEDVEIHIWFKLFYQLDRELSLRVSERAELSILTLFKISEVAGAKLCFIFIWMIEFLYSIMSFVAIVPIMAFLMILNVPALLWLIKSKRPSSVFLEVVVKRTLF